MTGPATEAQWTDQSSESVKRVSPATPTDGRTDGLTKNLQDQGDSLTFLNAHENGGNLDVGPALIGTLTTAAEEQIRAAGQRMPVVRQKEDRQLDERIRSAVLLRDGYSCRWCKRNIREDTAFEVDHIVPWSAGGTNATDNLRTLCTDCNQDRSNYRSDIAGARALLIVGDCPMCRGRSTVRSEDFERLYRYDDAEVSELGETDREAHVWCLACRRPRTTSRSHASHVRAKQVAA